jgi:hypothetical protein
MPAVNQQFVSRAVGASSAADDLEHMPAAQVLAYFAVKPDRGLSSAEATQRLARYCPNALIETERSLAAKLLGHFTRRCAICGRDLGLAGLTSSMAVRTCGQNR